MKMKKRLLLIVLVLLIFSSLLFTSRIQAASKYPKLSKSFFGSYLGEPEEPFLRRCEKNAKVFTKLTFTDKLKPGYIWEIRGCLSNNDSILKTQSYIFQDQVISIRLFFKDNSVENYKIIKKALENKYGENKAGMSSTLETKSIFSTAVNGHEVMISCDQDVNFSSDNTLILSYVYMDLFKKALAEEKNKKTNKIKNDL